MRRFKDSPIKQKLMVIVMATTTAALLFSGIGTVISDSLLFHRYLERDLSALVRIVADNSTAALAFEDPGAARETLAALKARTHIVAACIYRRDGTVLARYVRPDAEPVCPAPAPRDGIVSTAGGLAVSQAIVQGNERLGTLAMLYDLEEIDERARLYGVTVLGVLLASSVVAFLLSSGLQSVIATPIRQLAKATASVSETSDYSIRAGKISNDELGVLVDAFNEMLARIQSRDHDLREALVAREEALHEAQNARDFLETTLGSIGDAVISTDVEGRVLFANRQAQRLLRLTESNVAGARLDDIFRIVNEFSRATAESPVATVLRNGSIVGPAHHTVLIGEDGSEIPIEDSVAPIRGESGNIEGTVLVFRDVTARRRAEETRHLLASIVESSDDAIIGQTLDGTVTSWNDGAESIFGYSGSEMIGRPIAIIAPPDQEDEMPATLERIRKGQRVDQYEAARLTKNGRLINVSVTVSPVNDALGRTMGASTIARDITEQVRAAGRLAQLNADLQRSNESLARSNEDLERFAFVASHDLQEPLRMITIYSQLLIKSCPPQMDSQSNAFVSNIVAGTKRMRELLADLLAYTEIGGRPDEALGTVDLNSVIDKVTQNLKASIEESGATITAGALPALNGYEGHFIPLFQNLIANGIKYRSDRPPSIEILARNGDNELRFEVRDNGIGIDPEYHQRIFGAFKRLHGKKIPGTGIGLAICQRVVESYGGRIWVDSRAGEGSTFIFTLPTPGHAGEERR